jgi:histone H3/H4
MFKQAGGKRVSDQAAEELGRLIEEKAANLAIEAQRLSEHAGRRTVMSRDIKMAAKSMEKRN